MVCAECECECDDEELAGFNSVGQGVCGDCVGEDYGDDDTDDEWESEDFLDEDEGFVEVGDHDAHPCSVCGDMIELTEEAYTFDIYGAVVCSDCHGSGGT
jgi:hypothetical protein